MIVVLVILAFCTMILTTFLDNALENLKYRKQMQFPVHLKVEAYSFLDLALSFLGKYKADGKVESYSETTTTDRSVNKGSNKLIFDEEIISSGSSPDSRLVNNASITRYITKKISNKASIETDTNFSKLEHGEFIIEYSFEDLSAKLPLCKEFNTNSNRLLQAVINNSNALGLNLQQKRALNDFVITNEHTFTKWSTVEKVLRNSSSSSGNNPPAIDLENLKKYFTIEPCIIEAAKIKPPSAPSASPSSSNPFKINLLTVEPEISNALVSLTGIAFPTVKTISNYDALIQNPSGNLNNFCSLEVQFFSLKVCVSAGFNNSYIIHCICQTDVSGGFSANSTGRRLPFNIIKIEEF
ncbi:MAG: hypothetical protein LBI77_04010 [Puniceicoccales bacterium]|nr:hypothetical protein [Puniceicoccales bacterium]